MWKFVSKGIIDKKGAVLLIILLITGIFSYYARKAEVAYNFPKILPSDNSTYKLYESFKKKFGEEANTLIIGLDFKDDLDGKRIDQIADFERKVKEQHGVNGVLGIADLYRIQKDTVNKKMTAVPVFSKKTSGLSADSIKAILKALPVYKDLLYHNHTYMVLIRINQTVLDSKARIPLIKNITDNAEALGKTTGSEVHMSGLPLVRTIISTQVSHEISLFTILSFLITGFLLLLMLRAWVPVLISMFCVGIAVIWSLAFIVFFQFKISLLTGLLPPLVVIIGITNCVYIYNTYFFEWGRDKDKIAVLIRTIRKIGEATFFTNLTAAIGFGVFGFTRSHLLEEFGIVSFLSIISIFLITITIIPAVSAYLPVPRKEGGHTKNPFIFRFLNFSDRYSQKNPGRIFTVTIILSAQIGGGLYFINATGFIVDDIPKTDKLYTDLKYFEKEFGGVMPIEVMIDTKAKGKASPTRTNFYEKVSMFQDSLGKDKRLSRSISFADALKFINQAFYEGDTQEYKIPGDFEKNIILPYVANAAKGGKTNLLNNLIDSTKQVARVSANMADVGSKEMPGLLAEIKRMTKNVFDSTKYSVSITGTSVVNLEGNRYLINGLIDSLLLAFLLIAICIAYLFRSVKMVFISMLPNLIPLLITAGIMGWSGIPIKPSTVLIFSVAFGIAIDNAIRFLACYKLSLDEGMTKDNAVSNAQQEAGLSIVYTTVILFFGFIIFTASHFRGTFYLGLLTSITLLVALFNNMLVLPAMLRRFAK